MLRYAISDRTLFPSDESTRQQQVIQQAITLSHEGVDYFQLREKDLAPDDLFTLLCTLRDAIRATGAPTQLVLNGPHHLAERAGVAWHRTATEASKHALSCSVHTLDEVEQNRTNTGLLLFAPVFGKTVAGQPVQHGTGLQQLQEAVQRAQGTPVLALGGITPENTPLCMAAGAAGIAGIRHFLR